MDEKRMKGTNWKNRVMMSAVTIGVVAVLAVGGCSTQSKTSKMSTAKTDVDKEVSSEIIERLDAKTIEEMKKVNGIVKFNDFNVLVGSFNVDLKQIAVVESDADVEEVIKSVKIDDSKVDVSKTGKYTVEYEVTVQETPEAEEEVLTARATAVVVDEEEAKKLIAKGEEVIVSNNEVVSTEKQVAEAVKAIEDNTKKAEAEKTEDKKEEKKKETKKEDAKTNGNASTSSQTASNNNKNNNKNNNSSSSSANKNNSGSGTTHTHNWVAQYRTVDDYQEQPIYEDQPIYENQPVYATEYHEICNCGFDCGPAADGYIRRYQHMAETGCYAGYSNKAVTVQVGTQQVQVGTQQVQVGTQKVAVGSHQELTGYVCSGCGAKK